MNTNNQRKKTIIIIAAIIIIIIIGLAIYILFSSGPNNQDINNTNTITNNHNDNQPSTTTTKWNNYIVSMDITSIKLHRTREAMTAGAEDYNQEISLTTKDLTTILNNLNQLSIVKRYSIGMGMADGDTLTINYNKEGSNYTLRILNGIIFADQLNDTKLKELLEEAVTTTKDEQYKDEEGAFSLYEFAGDYSTVYDPYFE